MPVVKLIKDFTPAPGERTRKAGRTMNVGQDTARRMIAEGIAEIPANDYGLAKVELKAAPKTTTKKKADPAETPEP